MINFGGILKKAWNILWNYKVLWIFGILFAMTAGTSGSSFRYSFGGSSGGGSNNNNLFTAPGEVFHESTDWVNQYVSPLFSHPQLHVTTWIWIGVGILAFILICGVINALIRYPSETALIRMVNDYDQNGTRTNFKGGWKLGWSRAAFRIWVIDLLIGLPAILLGLTILGLGIGFFYSIVGRVDSGRLTPAEIAMLVIAGSALLLIFVYALFMIFVRLLRQFFARKAALENTGVMESFRQGWKAFTGQWKSAGLMWLIMLGIGIGFAFGTMILGIFLIPVFILLVIPALVVAAIPGLIAWGIASIFSASPLSWIIAIVVAMPFFILVIGSPLVLLGGLVKTYESSAWTLAYREMMALEGNVKPKKPLKPKKI